jgi:hypothetical protein
MKKAICFATVALLCIFEVDSFLPAQIGPISCYFQDKYTPRFRRSLMSSAAKIASDIHNEGETVSMKKAEWTSHSSFEEMGLALPLVRKLSKMNFHQPTLVQSACWTATRDGSGAVLMAPTGCGYGAGR